jgi:hypothetical protein
VQACLESIEERKVSPIPCWRRHRMAAKGQLEAQDRTRLGRSTNGHRALSALDAANLGVGHSEALAETPLAPSSGNSAPTDLESKPPLDLAGMLATAIERTYAGRHALSMGRGRLLAAYHPLTDA